MLGQVRIFQRTLFASLFSLIACSGAGEVADVSSPAQTAEPIAPADFVIAPCDRLTVAGDCLVLAAGGKRVLIGAPAGVGAGKIAGDDVPPDGVILLSLQAEAIEGLDEVRNRAWVSGRSQPLPIAGSDGVDRIVASLNEAYITSDALAYIEGKRRGGFDDEAVVATVVNPGDTAFNTGDLIVTAFAGGRGRLVLLIEYNGQSVFMAGCGAQTDDIEGWPMADAYIGCAYPAYSVPRAGTWPLTERLYFKP